MKTIKRIINTIKRLYSDLFDGIFDIHSAKGTSVLQEIYCSESYYITSGGVITRIEE